MQWEKETIATQNGQRVEALAPVILSASRATDVPAFYADWFFNRIRAGYFKWTNPFNAGQVQTISVSKVRVVVFWSKNPKSLLGKRDELERHGIHFYVQFTVNDFDEEGYEPHVPKLNTRIETFRRLAEQIGPERVIWRMDPLLQTQRVGIPELLGKADGLARQLAGYTRKLVFSYADVKDYAAVRRHLSQTAGGVREFTVDEMNVLAKGMVEVAQAHGMDEIATCAEVLDQEALGVAHNRCIDDELMIRLWPNDGPLMDFLGYEGPALLGNTNRPTLKDKGQRKACGCIVSKDIGRYGTCPHLCAYCYANPSAERVKQNFSAHRKEGETL